jgi:membrane fusion protein (multidrug efflux system)
VVARDERPALPAVGRVRGAEPMIWRFLVAVVLLVLVVGGIVGFNLFRDRAIEGYFATMQPPPVTVSVIEAKPITWQPGIEAIGTAHAIRGVELGVEAGGIVQDIAFNANDRVEAGQLLVQIDDRIERADLAAAEAQLQLSEETLKRVEALRERGVAPLSDLDVARADATNARAQVNKLSAVLAEKALKAPFAGIVGIPQVDVGEYVVPGTVYAALQDLDTMRVDFSIPEQELPRIRIGLPITVRSDAPEVELTGEITAIEPRIDPNSRLVSVRGEFDNPKREINPGQFLHVRVDLPPEDNVIALPQTVLSSNLYGDSVYVVRTEGEGEEAQQTVEQVFVKAGRRSQGLVEIVDGVEAGDEVVTAGQNRLSGGARVAIDNTVNPVPTTVTN